jgi:hypothetical protein
MPQPREMCSKLVLVKTFSAYFKLIAICDILKKHKLQRRKNSSNTKIVHFRGGNYSLKLCNRRRFQV